MRPVRAAPLAAALALAALVAHAGEGAERNVMSVARGTFDVQLTPQPADEGAAGAALGRLVIDKQFHGDLQGTSRGQMLAFSSGVEGSAGYVALERVSGTLEGRSGSFVLQHSGVMDRGEPRLEVTVVPDSGAGDLAGLAGRMTIEIADGEHRYVFEYTFGER